MRSTVVRRAVILDENPSGRGGSGVINPHTQSHLPPRAESCGDPIRHRRYWLAIDSRRTPIDKNTSAGIAILRDNEVGTLLAIQ